MVTEGLLSPYFRHTRAWVQSKLFKFCWIGVDRTWRRASSEAEKAREPDSSTEMERDELLFGDGGNGFPAEFAIESATTAEE